MSAVHPARHRWPAERPERPLDRPVRAVWRLMAPRGRAAARLWWLHPLAMVAIIGLVYASFLAFDFSRVVPTAWIPSANYAWGGVLLAGLAAGIAIGSAGARFPRIPPPPAFAIPPAATGLLLACTLLAYAVWFAPVMADPGLLLDIFAGRRNNLRNVAPTTPGLTTMTQFGVAFVVAHAAISAGRLRPLTAWERMGLAAVFALGALRSVAWGERLALMELFIPWAVASLAFRSIRRRSLWRAASWLPLVAPVLLYLAFTGTEYFRSWTFYRREYDSIWVFSFERLVAYYATASNNGLGFLATSTDWPQYTLRYVAEWLYAMPVIGEALTASVGDVNSEYFDFLLRHARPEFNNPSGLFPIVYDIGYAGSLLYFVVVGAIVGRLWVLWRRRSAAGVLAYPVAALFLVELLRFDYLASTRFFPVALGLLLLWAVSRPARSTAAWRAVS
jgi:hypothetical protein